MHVHVNACTVQKHSTGMYSTKGRHMWFKYQVWPELNPYTYFKWARICLRQALGMVLKYLLQDTRKMYFLCQSWAKKHGDNIRKVQFKHKYHTYGRHLMLNAFFFKVTILDMHHCKHVWTVKVNIYMYIHKGVYTLIQLWPYIRDNLTSSSESSVKLGWFRMINRIKSLL